MGIVGIGLLLLYHARLFLELMFARRMKAPGAIGMIGAMVMLAVNNNSKTLIGGAYDPTLVGIFVMLGFFHFCVYQNARYMRHLRSQPARAVPATGAFVSARTPPRPAPEGQPQ